MTDLELFEKMYLIRTFEETVQSLFQKGEIVGTTHLYSGQEAVAVGFASALKAQDLVAATYRGHGHALATGVTAQALMDEMLGRITGVCGGRSGSMNVIDLKNRLIGCFGIIGGSIGAATGAAISLARKNGVAIAFFGDGAINQAYFYECLNFAAVRKLPVIFICENNTWSEMTPISETVPHAQLWQRAAGYGMHAKLIDGSDLSAVFNAALDATNRARQGEGPTFLEVTVPRILGHYNADLELYRSQEDRALALARDPLAKLRAQLLETISEVDVTMFEAQIDAYVESEQEF